MAEYAWQKKDVEKPKDGPPNPPDTLTDPAPPTKFAEPAPTPVEPAPEGPPFYADEWIFVRGNGSRRVVYLPCESPAPTSALDAGGEPVEMLISRKPIKFPFATAEDRAKHLS